MEFSSFGFENADLRPHTHLQYESHTHLQYEFTIRIWGDIHPFKDDALI